MRSMKDVLADIGVQGDEEIQKVKQKPHAVIIEPEPESPKQEEDETTEFEAEVDIEGMEEEEMEIPMEDTETETANVTVPTIWKELKKDFIDCSFVEYITKEDSIFPWVIAGGIVLFGILIASSIWTA